MRWGTDEDELAEFHSRLEGGDTDRHRKLLGKLDEAVYAPSVQGILTLCQRGSHLWGYLDPKLL